MQNRKEKAQFNFFKKYDLIIYAVIFLMLSLSCLLFLIPKTSTGNYAKIYSDGKLIKILQLDTNQQFLYTYQTQSNLIIIEDGYVFVKESTCNDATCQKFGKINKNKQYIVCLPNKLKIVIVSSINGDSDFEVG